MTDLDIIKNVIVSLDQINVPTAYIQQIGVPLFEANNQLKTLYNFLMNKIQEEKKEEEAKPEEPEVCIEPVEEIPADVKPEDVVEL